MLVPKILKAVYLSDILSFLRIIYSKADFNESYERQALIDSMDGQIYKEYTKEMFKDKDVKIREMREEGILPKEFIVIDDLEDYY